MHHTARAVCDAPKCCLGSELETAGVYENLQPILYHHLQYVYKEEYSRMNGFYKFRFLSICGQRCTLVTTVSTEVRYCLTKQK